MTKKDYEALAEAIRYHRSVAETNENRDAVETCDSIAASFASIMEQDNERFSRRRFLAACRGEDSKDSAGRKVRYSKQDPNAPSPELAAALDWEAK
jgi:hypothetical protein